MVTGGEFMHTGGAFMVTGGEFMITGGGFMPRGGGFTSVSRLPTPSEMSTSQWIHAHRGWIHLCPQILDPV